jgi:hypothetical protein
MTVVVPILVGVAYAVLSSLIREPHRRRFNAVFVAGAGAAYLSGGGLGPWEVLFAAVMTYLAFRAGRPPLELLRVTRSSSSARRCPR